MSLLLTKGLGPAGGPQRVSRFDPANVQISKQTYQIAVAVQEGPKATVQTKVEFSVQPTLQQQVSISLNPVSVQTTIK